MGWAGQRFARRTRRRKSAGVCGEGERRSHSVVTHLGGRRHFAGEVQVHGGGVLLHEVIVCDVQIQRAAAGDEAVDLRRGREGGESRDEMLRREFQRVQSSDFPNRRAPAGGGWRPRDVFARDYGSGTRSVRADKCRYALSKPRGGMTYRAHGLSRGDGAVLVTASQHAAVHSSRRRGCV